MTASSRRLRVVYVTASLDHGGSERQMIALATRLPRDRFEVEFILLTNRGPFAGEVERAGIRVRVLGSARRATTPAPVFAARVAIKVLRYIAWARRGRYDIVDAWLYHAYALTALTKPLAGVPIMVAGRRSLSDFKDGFGLIDRSIDRLARRWSDGIVANAEAVRRDVSRREHLDPDRILVIRNGVEIPPALGAQSRASIRAQWRVADTDLVVGVVANYKPGKGLEAVVRTAGTLAASHPTTRFVLVGEGESRPFLERLIAERHLGDRVILHGSELDARRLYGAFDVVVQASETEGMPNVLLEAAAAGAAIVATDAGGTSDIVLDGQTGILVPIADEDALVRSLRQVLEDPALRASLGAAARDHVARTFGMDRLVAETAELYESLAAALGIARR